MDSLRFYQKSDTSGGGIVSERALTSFAASVHYKQVTVSGLHLYSHYLNIHYVTSFINPYPTAFPYGNGMVLHFYQHNQNCTQSH